MMFTISFTTKRQGQDKAGLSALLLCHGAEFTKGALFQHYDKMLGGALARAASLRAFAGKVGESVSLIAPEDSIAQFHLIGCAPCDDEPQTTAQAMQLAG
ncbi:MAG: leucyl aminopeptidase, partial [Bombella apis]|nr:leucyl aminopeptidase [Bombella apis]